MIKKLLKAILVLVGSVVLLALLAGLGVYGYMETAPTPAEVCAHIAPFSANPTLAGSPPALAACAERLGPPRFGQLPYARTMRCLNDAESKEDVTACSDSR